MTEKQKNLPPISDPTSRAVQILPEPAESITLRRPPNMEPVYGPWAIARTQSGTYQGELMPEIVDADGIARLGDWVSLALFAQDHIKHADIESALDRPWELQEVVSFPREEIILLRDTEPLLGADEVNLAPALDSGGFPRRKKTGDVKDDSDYA